MKCQKIESILLQDLKQWLFAVILMSDSSNSDVKFVYVLLDGVGDLPHPDLNGKTPLDVASTPNIDRLAQNQILLYSICWDTSFRNLNMLVEEL